MRRVANLQSKFPIAVPPLINLVTTFAMLIHAIVGCCAHHGHDAVCADQYETVVEQESCGHHHSDSARTVEKCASHDHGTPESCPANRQGGVCTDAKCSFVKASLQTLGLELGVSVFDVIANLAVIDGLQHSLAIRALPAGSVRLRGSAVLVCAQLQVWAI